MASVNLMTHLTLSSLHKMSTKKCREEGGCRLWCNWAPTSFVAHSYLGERPRSNKVTMSGDTPPKSGHNSVHNTSIMSTWEKSQGGTILGSYQPISSHNGGRKGKDMIHIYSIMYKYTCEWLDDAGEPQLDMIMIIWSDCGRGEGGGRGGDYNYIWHIGRRW